MTISPLALILLPAGWLFLWPLVDRWLRRDAGPAAPSPLLTGLTALSFSTGALAFALFGLGLLPGQWITFPAALVVVLLGWAVGLALNPGWLAPRRWGGWWRVQPGRLARLDAEALPLWAALASLGVILAHLLYYPFIGDDTLIRYGRQAQIMYALHRFPAEISGYPPLAPLNFVWAWFAAGAPNEHVAKLFAFVMAAGALGSAYLLGREAGGRRVGALTAGVLALTPLFVNNATLAYTDIATAFPLTLAALYALRWWRGAPRREAWAAGLLVAVALFTKQSALTWLATLSVIPLLWLIAARGAESAGRTRRALGGWAGFLLPPLALAGPWYLRNALLDGVANVLPVAGLLHLFEPRTGPAGLVPPLAWPADFGYGLAAFYSVGWVVGLALAARGLWAALRGEDARAPDLLLAGFAVPYWLAWWLKFSFDARFLLLVLPIMAVWAARVVAWLLAALRDSFPMPRRAAQAVGALLLAALLTLGTADRLGGAYRLLTARDLTDMERLALAKGPLADLVTYARETLDPAADCLYLMDERLPYFLHDFRYRVGYPQTLAELEGCDYVFHVSSIHTVYNNPIGWDQGDFYQYAFNPAVFEPVFESGGVQVMRILRTSPPEGE